MKKQAKTISMLLIAILGWFGIVLQFYLILANQTTGNSFWMRFCNFFSYFTILTNLLVAFSLTFTLTESKSRIGRIFSNPVAHTFVAMYIVIVAVIYFLLLRNTGIREGWHLVANVILHYVIPVAYLVYWLLFVDKSNLKWSYSLKWLIYPAIYFVYSLIRGEFTKWYPYPFLDISKSSYGEVLKNSAFLLVFIIVIGLIFIGIGKISKKSAGKSYRQFYNNK